jgi:hypothetical protein
MRIKRLPVIAALAMCTTFCQAQDGESIPDLGERTKDGFIVRCYWVGSFQLTERPRGQGMLGAIGQALSPLNYDKNTTATLILTEEADTNGKMRLKVHVARWSSKVSNCKYWSRAGQHIPAGSGGSGSGNIAPKDINVKATESGRTVSIDFGINMTGDEYKFDVRYVPLEITGLGARLSAEEKTDRWSPGIFGIVDSDEPVKSNRKTVIRQESGDRRGDFYSKWVVTRVCDTAHVHLVLPKGPRTQYTFDSNNPGMLDVNFLAAVTPNTPGILQKMKERVRFQMDAIGNSKLQWDQRNPNGKPVVQGEYLAAKLKFIGLPAKNDDFGKKKVQLLVDGNPTETVNTKVFFPKLATNHPGGVGSDPNWFYYWKEGNVCGIGPIDTFDSNPKIRGTMGYSLPWQDDIIRLCAPAAFTNDGPVTYIALGNAGWGSQTVCGHGKGIKCVAEVLQHEGHHIALYKAFHDQIARDKTIDPDGDGIPSAAEAGTDGIRSNPQNPDTFNISGSIPEYATYGDEEIRCRKEELKHTIQYHVEKDWADPGCQSKPAYGP